MDDWQLEVLKSGRICAYEHNNHVMICRTKPDMAMSPQDVIAFIRPIKKKPVIMDPDNPFRGKFALKKDVLKVLEGLIE